jgi:hypothetical protein
VTAAPGDEADVVVERFPMVPEAARLLLDVVTADVA